jgi:probable HAF family extracellular repeat protein
VSFLFAGSANAVNYSIIDLGTLGGSESKAYGINNSGQVVGFAQTSAGLYRAFLYTGGAMNDLGTLGGTQSYAFGINNVGEVVGYGTTGVGYTNHAFFYDGGSMNDLGTLGGQDSFANDINDAGQIVGRSGLSGGYGQHAFFYSEGVMTDIGSFAGDSWAHSINNDGQIVGGYLTVSGSRAFIYSDGVMTDLNDLLPADSDLTFADARAINSTGQIVGYGSNVASTLPGTHALFYENGVGSDLGTLGGPRGGSARSLNNIGQIVGSSTTSGGPGQAFLYENGVMINLNDLLPTGSGWMLTEAIDINDSGQIVGYGTIGGVQHAFLMTPVPLPAAVWLFGSGVLGLLAAARRRAGGRNQ